MPCKNYRAKKTKQNKRKKKNVTGGRVPYKSDKLFFSSHCGRKPHNLLLLSSAFQVQCNAFWPDCTDPVYNLGLCRMLKDKVVFSQKHTALSQHGRKEINVQKIKINKIMGLSCWSPWAMEATVIAAMVPVRHTVLL